MLPIKSNLFDHFIAGVSGVSRGEKAGGGNYEDKRSPKEAPIPRLITFPSKFTRELFCLEAGL